MKSENQCSYVYIIQKWGQNLQKMGSEYEHFHPKINSNSKKCILKYSLVWLGYFSHVLEDISASQTRINLRIAALKQSQFLGENADTQNPFFEDFDPISGLYIHSHIDFHLKYNHKCQH